MFTKQVHFLRNSNTHSITNLNMAPLKKPQSLVQCANQTMISNLCTTFVEDPSSKDQLIAINWFKEEMIPSISENLLKTLLTDDEMEPVIKWRLFKLLFNEVSTKLEFTFTNPCYYPMIAESLLSQGRNLQELNLHGVWFGDQEQKTFASAIKKMKSLKKLVIPHICNDEIISAVCNSSKNLRHLDISGSHTVSVSGFEHLYSETNVIKNSLTYLNLGGTSGRVMEAWQASEVVYANERLSSLGAYPLVGEAMAELWHYDPKPYNLRYAHDRKTTCETLQTIYDSLPDLAGLYLDSPVLKCLSEMPSFKNLRKLKLSKAKASELVSGLSALPRLLSLELVSLRGSLDLLTIDQLCPRLEVLQLFYCEGAHISNGLELAFESLKKLVLYDTESTYCAKPVLKKGLKLERLQLCDCSDLTDEELLMILEDNPLENLEILSLQTCPFLTEESLRYLITCLPKLRVIGQVDHWGSDPFALLELQEEIEHYNLDVTLKGLPSEAELEANNNNPILILFQPQNAGEGVEFAPLDL